jgi:hypothetical protein
MSQFPLFIVITIKRTGLLCISEQEISEPERVKYSEGIAPLIHVFFLVF